jgi:hypothetical protein
MLLRPEREFHTASNERRHGTSARKAAFWFGIFAQGKIPAIGATILDAP